jgi:hypothetical protein
MDENWSLFPGDKRDGAEKPGPWFYEDWLGASGKVRPVLLSMQRCPNPKGVVIRRHFSYGVYERQIDAPIRATRRPHTVEGTAQRSRTTSWHTEPTSSGNSI